MFRTQRKMSNLNSKKYQTLEKAFPYIITALFLILSVILILRHELWGDEAKAWNIAIGSSNIREFLFNMRDNYGHPFLWNAILYLISHFATGNPESMKIVHLILSSSTCFLFVKYSPFNKIINVLFVFGYFPFYEYSIVSRNYALGVLPIIIFCVLYRDKYKNLIPISIALFFMGQAHLYTFLISLFFLLLMIIDFISDRRDILKQTTRTKLSIFSLIIIAGFVLLFWELGSQAIQGTVWGPSVTTIFNVTAEQLSRFPFLASKYIISVFLQIPRFGFEFRNTNLIYSFLLRFNHVYLYILSLVIFLFPVLLMKKRIAWLYLIGASTLIGAIYFIYGGTRHGGLIFIFMAACIWLSDLQDDRSAYLIRFKRNKNILLGKIFLILVLSLTISSSATAAYYDYRYPYSSGKQIAEYIDGNFDLKNTVIVGYKDIDVHTIVAYLNKDIYFPQSDTFGRICPYSIRSNDLREEVIFKKALSFMNKSQEILVVVNGSAVQDDRVPEKYLFKRINKKFDDSIVGFEDFVLYSFKKSSINPLLDYKTLDSAEYENMEILPDKKSIFLNGGKNILKVLKTPIDIKDNTDYLISFEIKNETFSDAYINFDFFADGYDRPEQEFNVALEDPGEKFTQIIEILNSGEIPESGNIYFRIYTLDDGTAVIKNLEIYEIKYSE